MSSLAYFWIKIIYHPFIELTSLMMSFYTNNLVYIMRFFRALFLFLDQISSVIHTPSFNSSFSYRNLLLLLFFNNVIFISNFFEVVQIVISGRVRAPNTECRILFHQNITQLLWPMSEGEIQYHSNELILRNLLLGKIQFQYV